MTQLNKYVFYAILAGVLWGFTGACGRIMGAGGMTATDSSLIRFIISTVVFGIAGCKNGLRSFIVRPKDIVLFLCMGIGGTFFFAYFYFLGVERMTLSAVATFSAMTPLYTMVLSRFVFKEKLTAAKIVALFCAIAGCILTTGEFSGAMPSFRSTLLGILIGLTSALFSLFSRIALTRGYTSETINFYSLGLSTICGLFMWPAAKPIVGMFSSVENVLICLFLGIFIAYYANNIYVRSLDGLEVSKASILASSTPIVSAVTGVAFFHEQLTFVQFVGMLMIIVAVVLINTKSKQQRQAMR